MKRMICVVTILLGAAFSACAQQQPIRLIVRGDDMGYSHSGNEGIIKAYQDGIEKSIEVIVPCPWFPEAVKMLEQNPGVDVGIHLAITSEWDNVKWRPVSDCPSLKDEDGYFYPMVWPNKNYPGKAIKDNAWKLADVEKEFRAQIELGLKRIPRISHLSGHMGCSDMSDSVRMMTKSLAKEYNIDIDPRELSVTGVGYVGPHKTLEEKIQGFSKMLESLHPGNTYLFVDHPGLDSPELRAVSHLGYENVSADRQGVTSLWTDPKIKELIKKKGIVLISYRDLRK